jgi:hypothetical protein
MVKPALMLKAYNTDGSFTNTQKKTHRSPAHSSKSVLRTTTSFHHHACTNSGLISLLRFRDAIIEEEDPIFK